MLAKRLKILPYKYSNADISVWLDHNIKLLIDVDSFVDNFLGDADVGLFKHPKRSGIIEELEAIKTDRNYAYNSVRKQVDYYKKLGFKDNMGLYECGVLVIRHNRHINEMCRAWWNEIKKHSTRDQISLPYILSKYNIKLKANIGDVRNHIWFKFQ